MNVKQILIAIMLLVPFILNAQENVIDPKSGMQEIDYFNENVVNKVQTYNAETRKLYADIKAASVNKSADTIALKKQIDEVVRKCFQVPQEFIKAHPSSPYSCRALKMLGKGEPGYPVSVAELERLFNSLSPEIKDSDSGKAYLVQLASWKERDKHLIK
jgi:uncharacterized protein involved in exopolysaccharide biosynthesis